MSVRLLLLVIFTLTALLPSASAEPARPLTLGYLGSLSGQAASYGQAVLEGVRLAAKELDAAGRGIRLAVEDDHTEPRNTVTAFQKLIAVEHVDAIIAGSWWANGIVRPAEQQKLLLLSCETLYDKQTRFGATYFIMAGDLRDWVRAYEPLVAKEGWRSAAIIRFTSGFADTLAEEMKRVFSAPGRRFSGDLVYSHFEMDDAPQLVVQLKRLAPDVVYIDGQPGGVANVLRKLDELGIGTIAVLGHSVIRDAADQRLFNPEKFPSLYFTDRRAFESGFASKFQAEYGKAPYLHADLGYYAVKLAVSALGAADPAHDLAKRPRTLDGAAFRFDDRHVLHGIVPDVWRIREGKATRVD